MITNYVCPSCGYHIKYSDEIAESIVHIVCNRLGITRDKMSVRINQSDTASDARAISSYMIRRFTGAKFSVISRYLKLIDISKSGKYYIRVCEQIEQDGDYKVKINSIEKTIVDKLNEKSFD